MLEKSRKAEQKKEFCNTITRRSGKPLFSGQCWISLHDNARIEKSPKMHRNAHQKKNFNDTTRAGEYQDILDTLKAEY